MQMRFVRPVRSDVTATGRIIHGGRRIVQLESRMLDDTGRLVATGNGSWFRHEAP